jgi:hypothetical protein
MFGTKPSWLKMLLAQSALVDSLLDQAGFVDNLFGQAVLAQIFVGTSRRG